MADWIPFDGSGPPVALGVHVDVKIRSGAVDLNQPAWAWDWYANSTGGTWADDIVAYRIHQEQS